MPQKGNRKVTSAARSLERLTTSRQLAIDILQNKKYYEILFLILGKKIHLFGCAK